jgi:hypothetical protein
VIGQLPVDAIGESKLHVVAEILQDCTQMEAFCATGHAKADSDYAYIGCVLAYYFYILPFLEFFYTWQKQRQ